MKTITVYEVLEHNGSGPDIHVCFAESVEVATDIIMKCEFLEYSSIEEKEILVATSYCDFLKFSSTKRKALGF